MDEYIDKDKLLNAIECIDISDCTDVDDIFTEIERTIDEHPTADVADVIMCKDCKHLTDDGLCWENIHAVVGYKTPNPNDFCSYGERKDGDESVSKS